MGYHSKKFEDLTLRDDFIFGNVMKNKALCKELLEIILEVKIRDITYPEEQKTIKIIRDARSIRLDVYVEDDQNTVYNVEMQTTNPGNLPKRTRYYQGLIDLNLISKGEDYDNLKKSYVIFICVEDIFGQGRYIYTFENICLQDFNLRLGDDSTKIFLNADGYVEDISPELKAFLVYLRDGVISNTFTKNLEDAVEAGKNCDEWRREYMTLQMRDRENYRKGRKEGQTETTINNIKNMMKNLGCSIDKAMDVLEIPAESRGFYKKNIGL